MAEWGLGLSESLLGMYAQVTNTAVRLSGSGGLECSIKLYREGEGQAIGARRRQARAIDFISDRNRPAVDPKVAQVAQVTVRHTVFASGPCSLGDPEQRRPALRPLGYPTDCP